jgi:uncharacterized radical SAM superfamily protein
MNENLEELLEASRRLSLKNFGRRIMFYAPSFIGYQNSHYRSPDMAFPSISITGSTCALKCKHCGGKVLKTMIPATNPKSLFDVCGRLREKGSTGCLISGGCLPDGSMPLENFVDAIAHVKRVYGLTITIHTGIIGSRLANGLRRAGVDTALIDIIGSDDTIREIYGLNLTVEDYDLSLKALHDSKIHFAPHIIVGLHYGKLKGEFNALKMVAKYKPSALVIIALIPLKGTPMEKTNPPTPEDIAKVMATARIMLPETPLALGCMRPTGEHRIKTDTLAVEAGVNAIAFPEDEAIDLAEFMGLRIEFSSKCCSQVYEDPLQSQKINV